MPIQRRYRCPLAVAALAFSPIAFTQPVNPSPGPWPAGIENLLFDYLSSLPGLTFPLLTVRCDEHHCIATYVPAAGPPQRPLGNEELSPLIWKGWHVISVGTGGSFDPASGAGRSWIVFSNDESRPNFPEIPRVPDIPLPDIPADCNPCTIRQSASGVEVVRE